MKILSGLSFNRLAFLIDNWGKDVITIDLYRNFKRRDIPPLIRGGILTLGQPIANRSFAGKNPIIINKMKTSYGGSMVEQTLYYKSVTVGRPVITHPKLKSHKK